MATANSVPRELNWVEKRAACSARQIFAELVRGIDNDVATINAVKKIPESQRFTAEMLSDDSTLVVGQIGIPSRTRIKIGIVGDRIETSGGSDQPSLSASVTLNKIGRASCRERV